MIGASSGSPPYPGQPVASVTPLCDRSRAPRNHRKARYARRAKNHFAGKRRSETEIPFIASVYGHLGHHRHYSSSSSASVCMDLHRHNQLRRCRHLQRIHRNNLQIHPHASHGTVSPSSTSSTSTTIGLSHSVHTTAIIEPPGFWFRPPAYRIYPYRIMGTTSRTPPLFI